MRLSLLGCLVGAAMIGIGLSCVTQDPDYCESRAQCIYVDTPLGPMQPFCHPTRHTCVLGGVGDGGICLKDEDCPVDMPRCNVDTNGCTPCHADDPSDTSCARFLDRPLCGAATDGSGTTQCLACRSNLDCHSDTPICDNQQCRKCATHSDCEGELKCDDGNKCTDSMVCIGAGEVTPDHAGSCAQNGTGSAGRVVYVNNLDPSCSTIPGSAPMWPVGSQLATPQCTLQFGFEKAAQNNRRYIRVLGKDVSPLVSPISDGLAYSIIGAPTKSAPMATVSGRNTEFMLTGSGALTLDGLDITEVSSDGTPISCSGGITGLVPSLTVRHCIVRGSSEVNGGNVTAGIMVSSCNTLIEGSTIGLTTMTELMNPSSTAHGQGLSFTDQRSDGATSYLVQNNLIAGNLGVALNLQGLQGTGAQHFVARFNTIVGNGRNTMPVRSGAVYCAIGSKGQEVSHSIVWMNSLSNGQKSQFANTDDCGVKDLVVGSTENWLNNPEFKYLDPELDDSFHLKSGNSDAMCCLDKVTPGSGEVLPSQDIVGTSRPQGASWDIGAHELKP